jgi:hypothetical protein
MFADPYGLDATGEAVGRAIGTWGGRIVGGAVGSVEPGGGTIVGGIIGGAVGGRVGGAIGSTIGDLCKPKDNDLCHKRWDKEDKACNDWKSLGPRVVRACKDRASDRRTLCIRNGGTPDPNEPPEYSPFRDYPR